MYYSIVATDIDDSLELRKQARPDHIARLNELANQGRLLVAGPNPRDIDSEDPGPAGFSGSVIIAEFTSLQEAQTWADQDPYLKAGVYKEVITKPFKPVLP
ncbi:MAG: YciI family protein [Gammaproteobacteria bacterium]|nr:YciI family protein [Gammaproteobacteria bacterium]